MKTFPFEMDTPYHRFYSGQVEAITLTLSDGEITVYADHSFFVAPVVAGLLRIKDKNGNWKNAFVGDGVLEVKSHTTFLMADTAEWPEEIDREQTEASLAEAEETISAGTFKFEIDSAKAQARRAKLRLKVKEMG